MGIFDWLFGKKNIENDNGINIVYNESGITIKEFFKKNGNLDGLYKEFKPKWPGSKDNELVKQTNCKNGKIHGKYIEFHTHSSEYNQFVMKIECNYKEGELHGSYKEFHPPHSGYVNQDIKIDCNYKNGKLHGSYKEYNQYQRINIHKHVDTQGEVIEEEMYENGILLDKGTGE